MANHGGDEDGLWDADPEIWSDEEMAKLSLAERRRLVVWIAKMIESDFVEAVSSGSYFARIDAHIIRAVPQVDERGWRELSQIHQDALDAVLRVQADSAERLRESGETGTPVLSALICCELPADRPPEPDRPRKVR